MPGTALTALEQRPSTEPQLATAAGFATGALDDEVSVSTLAKELPQSTRPLRSAIGKSRS